MDSYMEPGTLSGKYMRVRALLVMCGVECGGPGQVSDDEEDIGVGDTSKCEPGLVLCSPWARGKEAAIRQREAQAKRAGQS
jgi:hypothetical protein